LLIVKPDENTLIALEADELNHVLEVNQSDVKPVPEIGGGTSSIDGIVNFPNVRNQAMLVINPQTLIKKLEQNSLSSDWEEMLPLIEKMKAEEKFE
jgi:chemotaxis signal transduction protein